MKSAFRSTLNIVIILFSTLSLSFQTSLYTADDPLWELNSSNFDKYVYGKNNAWIIEFYNSWCGHCIRFAPTWQQLARDTQNWKNVIDVAVVNCNEKENTALCRQYSVDVFPTIKLFWHNINETEPGEMFTHGRNISAMESAMVSFLESHWSEGVPSTWPSLSPIEEETIESLVETIPKNKQSITIFVEHPDSFVGRKIILDMSFQKNHIVKRLLSSSELLKDLKSVQSNQSIPALIEFHRNSEEKLLIRFSKEHNDTYIRDKVFEQILGRPRNTSKIDASKEKVTTEVSVIDHVYMTDLENAIYYSLSQEVGMSKYIKGEKMSALKAFLSVLKNYFPGSKPVMAYLSKLYNRFSYKKHSTTGGDFVQEMENLQGEEEYLPKMRDWVGCRGSISKYRGYPCSLWTLFHTLTVQADKVLGESHGTDAENTGEVLFIIRDYIKYFFTCEECAQNFLEMAENVENDVKSSRAAMLWLWRAHNKVNSRLAGDMTEDPMHPKIQFPSTVACPNCRTKDGTWNEAQVSHFLHQFYGVKNILINFHVQDQDSHHANKILKISNSAMDIRISLYFLSILLFSSAFINHWRMFESC